MSSKLRIGVDPAGDLIKGRLPVDLAVAGSIRALRDFSDISIYLAGDSSEMERAMRWHTTVDDLIMLPTNGFVDMHGRKQRFENGSPGKIVSTISRIMKLYAEGGLDAVFSPGNTGETVKQSVRLDTILEVHQVIANEWPSGLNTRAIVCDIGSLADPSSLDILYAGVMATTYAREVYGIEDPRLGLCTIGTEFGKGNKFIRECYALLEKHSKDIGLNFIGNVEPKPLTSSDIFLADAQTMNPSIKFAQGTIGAIRDMKTQEINESYFPLGILRRMYTLIGYPLFWRTNRQINPPSYSGAPLLGVDGNVLIGHGKTSEDAFYHGIRRAAEQARYRKIVDEHHYTLQDLIRQDLVKARDVVGQ